MSAQMAINGYKRAMETAERDGEGDGRRNRLSMQYQGFVTPAPLREAYDRGWARGRSATSASTTREARTYLDDQRERGYPDFSRAS